MRVAVIGIGGVGMAHVIAATRVGFNVVALIEKDSNILGSSRQGWKNVWKNVVEEAVPQKGTIYSNSIGDIPRDVDIIIVATPPDTHVEIVDALIEANFRCRIIVEKPLSMGEVKEYPENVEVSCEWIYSSFMPTIQRFNSLGMSFTRQKKNWKYQITPLANYAPHLFSILMAKGVAGSVEIIEANKVDFSMYIGEALVYGSHHGDFGLTINGVSYSWEKDLFDKQLLSKNHPTWNSFVGFHNSIKDYIYVRNRRSLHS